MGRDFRTHLQIVSDELFGAVERRFAITQKLWGWKGRALPVANRSRCTCFPDCLSVASVAAVSRWWAEERTRHDRSTDALHAQRDDSVCRHGLRIQRQQFEGSLLSGFRDKVLREEFVEYLICGLQEELRQRHENLEAGLERLRDEKRRIEVELKRLVDTIAAGNSSATVMATINEREASCGKSQIR